MTVNKAGGIIRVMERTFRPFQTGSDADLAFAVVVLASYFTTFSILQSATTLSLLLMIALGVAYITVGIYGYAFAVRSGKLAYQISYFSIQILLGGGIVYMGQGIGFTAMALLPLAGHSVVLLPKSWRLMVNLLIVMTYVLANELYSGDISSVWSGLPIFLAGQIFIVVFTQMAVNEERARAEVELLVKELEAANQRLRAFALQVEELATTRERNRLAREIHDGLGHYLTTIHMQIQAARVTMNTDLARSADAMQKAQNLTQEALLDVRQSVSALRDTPGESFSLLEELEKMVHGCEEAGISSELKLLGSLRSISPQTTMTIYRTAQEGISNTCKHSQARLLTVTLDFTQSDQVRLVIQDDGNGASTLNGGFGLLGIRERVQLLSGSVNVVTEPGSGFKLEIQVPG
jgi:signal transduction histidine kinase